MLDSIFDLGESVLFITLDSCRFDTFLGADAPNLKAVARLWEAQSPSHFTYGSHAAMFAGFTPGLTSQAKPYINPKYARLFRLHRGGWAGQSAPGFEVVGRDIIHGFRASGHRTIGTAAVGWFDPENPVEANLIGGFDDFFFAGDLGVKRQIKWISDAMRRLPEDSQPESGKVFVFLNVGETHVPYFFEGAPWSRADNPCIPFQTIDRSDECRNRQRLCLEYVDAELRELLEMFHPATIIVCADHGDCWGEDGLWEHGIAHPMTLTVPLLIRYKGTSA